MAEAAARRRWWLAPAAVGLCVALELLLAMSGLDGRLRVVGLTGLAGAAVAIALAGSMGLRREALALRATIAAPLVLAVITTVVLMVEAAYRRGSMWP